MRNFILIMAFMFALLSPGNAHSDPVTSVIENQINAFKADDSETAFSFASPKIRLMFGTPDRFASMVRDAYPMVWRPGAVRFLNRRELSGRVLQQVQITDQKGKNHWFMYEMVQVSDAWKINGVFPIDAPGVSA